MSVFPRFVSHDFPRMVVNDFAPVWRLLDDYANQVISARSSATPEQSQVRSFNPRFDVREVEGGYELKGELPGVESSNVEIEFPDSQTVVIKGSTGYSRQEKPVPARAEQSAQESAPAEKSHQASVEDEAEVADATSHAATPVADAQDITSPVTTPEPTPAAIPELQAVQSQAASTPAQPSRYWLSERFTGDFQRTFTFPAPVATEDARAKLRNGVLELVIPKMQKVGIKRIAIE